MLRATPRTFAAALSALALGLALPACGGDGDGGTGVLGEAAPYVEAGGGTVQYTDWAAVRGAFGADDLTGAGAEEQFQFLGELAETASIAPAYSQSELDEQTLGFGPLDLDWEVSATPEEDGGSLSILGAGDDLDFEATESALDSCGYDASEIDGGTLYSKPLEDPCESDDAGLVPPNPALSNVAVLPDDGVLIASGDPDAVAGALEDGNEGLDPVIDDLGSELDGSAAGFISYGEVPCFLPPPTGTSLGPKPLERAAEEAAELGAPYESLLASIELDGEDATGSYVLDFADADEAESQLDARREVFEEGNFAATQVPITDVFSLDAAEVADDAIVFDVSPPEGEAQLDLLSPVLNFDIPFAVCG